MKKSYYAIIPANVRYDERLTDGAKLLYGEITALCNQEGYCWASDGYFKGLYRVSRSTIQRWMTQLEEFGYIRRNSVYEKDTTKIKRRYIFINETPYTQKWDRGIPKNETPPIPKSETVNNTSINTTSNKEHEALFQEWWDLYDNKKDRKKCSEKYKRLLREYSHEEMMEGTKKYLKHLRDLKKRGEFAPNKRYPMTFLNNENFNDEYEVKKVKPKTDEYQQYDDVKRVDATEYMKELYGG